MDSNISLLQAIAHVINTNIGKVITRKNLLYAARDNDPRCSDRYLDKTRRQLTVCGYLEDTGKPGRYKAVKPIPSTLTVSRLYKDYCAQLDAGYKDPEFICNSETLTNSLKEIRECQERFQNQ